MSGSVERKRARVGLALGGGAARGMAHVGVLRVFAEHEIPIDCIAGTSAGSLVGAAFAAGVSLDELERIARSLRWRDVGRMTLSKLGVQSNARMTEYVQRFFPVTKFEELKIPFAAVATDLHTGEEVVIRDAGDLALAIRASCAVPGWYIPVTDERGRQLVDGGLVSIVPSAAARDLGADVVIAVDVNAEGAKFLGPPTSALGVLLQSFVVVQKTAASHQLMSADVVIEPKTGHIRWDEMSRADELMKLGEKAARERIEEVKEIIARKTKELNSKVEVLS